MLFRSLTIWLALCGSLAAQTIVGPSSANVGESVAVRVTGVTLPTVPAEAAKAVLVAVDSPDETRPASLFGGVFWDFATGQPQLLLFFRAETSGVYVLSAVAPKEATPKIVSKRIAVGEVVPPTPNPIPPGPGPNPTPNPTPPAPAPIPLPGLRVLVIYETNQGTTTISDNVTREQAVIITGAETRALLSAKCAKDAKGHPEFRFFDQHADLRNSAPHWFSAFNRPRGKLPWLIVSDGRRGYEGPLPANKEEFAKLLEGFGP